MSWDRRQAVMDALQANDNAECNWYEGYTEPGYTDPERGVISANWNNAEREGKLLDRLGGYELEWCDEWTSCGQCGKAVRTQPDSYSWLPSFKMCDGGIDCKTCLLEDLESYVDGYLLNRSDTADTFGADLGSLGFTRLDEKFETGWHPGQDDDPADVLKKYEASHNVVFQIDGQGQFDTSWSAWLRLGSWMGEES